MNVLEGQNLSKTYRLSRRNSVEALRGVDIEIGAGEMVSIMGPSGSGKSTLMHILGLLHAPDLNDGPAPRLWVEGRDATALSDRERTALRARRMGFVFQSFNLVPTLSAAENVALASIYAGTGGTTSRRASEEALAWVGLDGRGDHRPAELSGGEQQRVAIARALVNRPAILLGDEPTGNLDSARSREILQLLRRFNQHMGVTVVLVTHDAEVGTASDRIIRMRDGLIELEEETTLAA
jgi:putative ABC transport system ATP-binding protein